MSINTILKVTVQSKSGESAWTLISIQTNISAQLTTDKIIFASILTALHLNIKKWKF